MDDNRRSFELNNETFYINPPNSEDIRGADWNYSKVYTKSLTEGITTSAEMRDILRRRGIIGPEYEQRANELARNLNDAVYELSDAKDIETKRKLSNKVVAAREELFLWNQRFSGPMSHTCEQMADDARLDYLTSCMVCRENNSKVWNSYDEYLTAQDRALAMKARLEVMLFIQGIESNFMENTPEAIAEREIEDELVKNLEKEAKINSVVEAEAKEDEIKLKNKGKNKRKA